MTRPKPTRERLTRERLLDAAVARADAHGIEGLTMRGLAAELGVEAMSLYHHIAGKDALLDGIVDRVYQQIESPPADGAWQEGLRRRSRSVRAALLRHPWALPLMESRRTPGPATLAYHDANIACLRAAGFSPTQVAHAYAVLDAYVYGFVLQETSLPFDSGEQAVDLLAPEQMGRFIAAHPNMAWFVEHVVRAPGYSFDREFEPGLELVLAGLAALLD